MNLPRARQTNYIYRKWTYKQIINKLGHKTTGAFLSLSTYLFIYLFIYFFEGKEAEKSNSINITLGDILYIENTNNLLGISLYFL